MVFRFENYELDVARYSLQKERRIVKTEPKVLELLAHLLKNRDHLITKGELLDALWDGKFVSDGVLTRCVYLARLALGDNSQEQRFIKTVRGRGYQFSESIEVEMCLSTTEANSPPKTGGDSLQYIQKDSSAISGLELIVDGRRFPLKEGVNIIGRIPEATVQLRVSGVSRHHARITVDDGLAVLEDLGSKNGTFLHGRKLTAPEKLTNGDPIGVGRATLVFREISFFGTTITETGNCPT